jgi:peptide/nickel transport system permease protein
MQRKSNFIRGCIKFSRNKLAVLGVLFLLMTVTAGVFAPFFAPYPEDAGLKIRFNKKLLPPGREFLLGTDDIGRDVLSRILFGIRISLSLAVTVLAISVPIGILLGTCAAYFGGWVDQLIMRVTDIVAAIPALVFALVVSALLTPSLQNSILAISFVWWRSYCRLAYGEALSIKQEDYVTASRSLGASHFHIMFKEIFPNMFSPVIVKATLDAGHAILIGTSISFLGIGASPPTPELGIMVAHSRNFLPTYWWPSLFPGLAIVVIVLSFNLVGDGLRDFFGVEEVN